jgi:serpin B
MSRRTLSLALIGPLFVVMSVSCSQAQPASSTRTIATPTPRSTASAATAIALAKADVARSPGSDTDAAAAADAINGFAFDLHRKLSADGGNVVFSPASVAIALGMARAGAAGDTASEMDAVLYSVASDDHGNWLNALDQALALRSGRFQDAGGASHEITLDIANAYFAQSGFSFRPAFLEALASRFGAGMQLVDFERDPEAARGLINAWANSQTRGRIPEVLQQPDVTPATRLALVNAIYLKAPWLQPFAVEATTSEAFRRPNGSVVQVPMMHANRGLGCASGPGWGSFAIPYIGSMLSMIVIVPDELGAFEATLDPAAFDRVIDAMAEQHAGPVVSLPKFETETRAELPRILAELGMPTALDPSLADFSGMTTEEALFISKVVHQANISVDEEGTEAAAVTVVGMDTTGGAVDECKVAADRPFLFAVRDIDTGAILFMGRVVDPTATS